MHSDTVLQKPPQTTPTTRPTPTSQSAGSVQLKRALRGQGFEAQEKMLAPPDGGGAAPVQADKGRGGDKGVHVAAEHGTKGGGGNLPHLDAIQQSFGSHDVSGVQAHTGGNAREANDAMGANAYATGNHVAFKGAPDLHTAAHEAAHVVQQRSGVSLKGGVGQVGDPYERHADQVADAVVAGKSAESLLDGHAGGVGGDVQKRSSSLQMRSGGVSPVQRDAKSDAHDLESRDKGHSLGRHGPEVTDDALKKRLSTGIAPDGAFCCAPGLSTRFISYDEYLKTRTDGAAAMDSAVLATKAALKTEIDEYETERARVKNVPPSKDKPAEIEKVSKLRDKLEVAAGKISVPSADKVPVKVGKFNMNSSALDLLQTPKSYEIVKNHGRDVGEGFAGSSEKEVKDPNSDKTGKGYDVITKAPNMKKTRTTYGFGGVKKLSEVGSAAAWKAVQHFPCDETEGIS